MIRMPRLAPVAPGSKTKAAPPPRRLRVPPRPHPQRYRPRHDVVSPLAVHMLDGIGHQLVHDQRHGTARRSRAAPTASTAARPRLAPNWSVCNSARRSSLRSSLVDIGRPMRRSSSAGPVGTRPRRPRPRPGPHLLVMSRARLHLVDAATSCRLFLMRSLSFVNSRPSARSGAAQTKSAQLELADELGGKNLKANRWAGSRPGRAGEDTAICRRAPHRAMPAVRPRRAATPARPSPAGFWRSSDRLACQDQRSARGQQQVLADRTASMAVCAGGASLGLNRCRSQARTDQRDRCSADVGRQPPGRNAPPRAAYPGSHRA